MARTKYLRPSSRLLMAALLMIPATASAKIDTSLKEELTPYVTKLSAEEVEAEARQAALMTWGFWADQKAQKEIETFKVAKKPEVRLGAGLALVNSGARKSQDFLATELLAQGKLLPALQGRVAPLSDNKELGIIDTLLKAQTKPEQRAQIMQYLSQQDGILLDKIHGFATAKKPSANQDAAIAALIRAARPESLGVATELLAKAPKKSKTRSKKKKVSKKAKKGAKTKTVVAPKASSPLQEAGVKLALAIAAQNPKSQAAVVTLLQSNLAKFTPATRVMVLKRLLGFNDAKALTMLLKEAATSTDKSTRTDLLVLVRDAIEEKGLSPSYAEIEPILKAKDLSEFEQVLGHQIAAASGDKGVQAKLLKFFVSRTFEERLLAAQALPYTKDKGVVALLSKSLFEGDRRMRLYSAQGLGVLKDEAGLKALQSSLNKERDKEIRVALLKSVGKIKSPEASRILRFQARSNDANERMLIVEGVRRHNLADGLKTLQQLQRDRDENVRWQSFLAMLQLDSKRAKPMFSTMFRTPPSTFMGDLDSFDLSTKRIVFSELSRHSSSLVRPVVLDHLLQNVDKYDNLLRSLLASPSTRKNERLQILGELAKTPTVKDISLIERLAKEDKDVDVMHEAAWTLARLANPQMEATFRGLMSSSDPVVQSLAVYSLASIHDAKGKSPKRKKRR